MSKFGAVILAAMITAPVATFAQTIDVPFKGNFGRVHYWCAAGQKVIASGFPATTMIYRTSPDHRSAGQGMSFSLDGGRTGPWNAFPAFAAANMCHEGSGPKKEERREREYEPGDDVITDGDNFFDTITAFFR